jgi:uncharacterized membrane protein YjjB (DUF3815 family)
MKTFSIIFALIAIASLTMAFTGAWHQLFVAAIAAIAAAVCYQTYKQEKNLNN